MYQFEGCECPICNKELHAGDDIVVCPDCGTPYHRDCFAQAGSCVHAAEHDSGFEWQPPQLHQTAVACPACGAACAPDATFCNQCGQPLRTPDATQEATASSAAKAAQDAGIPDFVAEQLDLPEAIDGISLKDWVTYIGPSAPYYLFQFRRQDQRGNKLGFILSAAFFAPYYFFYRRVWAIGLLALAVNLLLNTPAAIMLLQEIGYTIPFSFDPVLLSKVGWVCSVLLIVVNTLWGFFAAYIYRRHSARTMKRWQQETGNETLYQTRLRAKSGPCRAVLLILIAIFTLALFGSSTGLLGL